jgi:hypothetical protein
MSISKGTVGVDAKRVKSEMSSSPLGEVEDGAEALHSQSKDAILKRRRTGPGFTNVDPDELTPWKVCGFLCFDQFLRYIPLSQGIYHDRQEPQEGSLSMQLSRRRRVARGRHIVEHFPSP